MRLKNIVPRKQEAFWPKIVPVPAFLLLWEAFCRLGIIDPSLCPPPTALIATAVDMATSGELLKDLGFSVQRVLIGFVAGGLGGVVAGVLTGRFRLMSLTFGQLLQLFRPIPAIAFVPLAIIWLGLGESSKYALIAWGVFFPVWVNTHLGVSRADKAHIWAALSLGASKRSVIWLVILPSAVPFILAGLRVGFSIAFVCLIAAEMAGAFWGLGYRIQASYLFFRVDKMLVGIAVLGAVGAISDQLFWRAIKRVFPWCELK